MAVHYILIFSFSRQTTAAPTSQKISDFFSDTEMELEAAGHELNTYLGLAESGTVDVSAWDPWPPARRIFKNFKAFNFEEFERTCGDIGVNFAAALMGVKHMQDAVVTERKNIEPDYNSQAWDWFFMKNDDNNPNGWARSPETWDAWRAITRTMSPTNRELNH